MLAGRCQPNGDSPPQRPIRIPSCQRRFGGCPAPFPAVLPQEALHTSPPTFVCFMATPCKGGSRGEKPNAIADARHRHRRIAAFGRVEFAAVAAFLGVSSLVLDDLHLAASLISGDSSAAG